MLYPRWPVTKERSSRSKHSNVRTGCITCKTRHKKCDETQPACRNCVGTGRKCDGYSQVPDRRTRDWRNSQHKDSPGHNELPRYHYTPQNKPVTVLEFVDPNPVDLCWNDRWHLDYFRKCTAVHFCGYFEDAFWGRLVLQMCEGQAAVRHAAIALSARQRQFEKFAIDHGEDRECLLTLSHTHRSITCLREDLTRHATSGSHIETVLVTCILLTVLAVFQEELDVGRCHLMSGLELFRQWQVVDRGRSSNWKALKLSLSQVHSAFEISANAKEFADDKPFDSIELDESKIRFYTAGADELERYRSYMMVIGWQIVESHPGGGFKIGPASSPIPRGGLFVMSKMRLWRGELRTLLAGGVNSPVHRDLLALLELYTLIIYLKVCVASSPKPTETLFDEHLKAFHRVVLISKDLLCFGPDEETASFCYVKSSVSTALLWCGVRCRDWLLREEILRLLSPHKVHSPWVSTAMLALNRVIEIESRGVKQGEFIPDFARVQSIDVKVVSEGSKVQLTYSKFRNERSREDGDIVWKSDILSAKI